MVDVGTGRVRVTVLLAALALALGAVACGSDDDDGDGGNGGGDAAAQSSGGSSSEAASGPKKELEADYDKFVDHIYDGRWKHACAGYSAAYIKKYPKQLKIASTCTKTMSSEYGAVSSLPRPYIAKIEVTGSNRAVGYTKTRDDSTGNPIKFVKENGTWKLDGSIAKR